MQFNIARAVAGAASFAVLAAVAGTGAVPAAADETRSNRVLVVLVVLADFEDQHHADAGTDRAGIAQRYFGAEGSLQSYYRAVSRGRLSYVPAVPDKVLGPLTLPWRANCDPRAARQEIERQLPQRGLTKGKDYDSLSIVLPRVPCAWAGLAQVGGPVSWLKAGKGGPTLAAVAHEFGHNLGLPHQPRRVCAGGDLGACGGPAEMGRKSPMGGGGAGPGLSVTQLVHAGWLAAGEHQRVTASGTFVLRPLYGGQKGVRALEVPLGHDRLVLEYRRPEGALDGRLNGVYAYRVSGDSYRSADPLSPSSGDRDGAVTTLDDAAAKLTVTVGEVDADSATVTVTVNGVAAPAGATTAPAVVVPPENPAASAPANPGADPGADPDKDLAHTGGNACTGRPAQSWDLIPVPGRSRQISVRNARSGLCLTHTGTTADGAPVRQAVCDGNALQVWTLNRTGDGRAGILTGDGMHLGLKEWARADRQAHDPLIATSPYYYGSPSLRFRVD
ncbi:RICIN domain-containing protein [Kitasatospora purpeofusca]|uniref:RICIN domain-containing protein n=1 Tax=Kitasatospora purpeofusca TaxID=67352 RepID=UPI0022591519|nr:RICIN domain-containing protein [Kitasatospora purpeofusca]MCX4755603.1 RICIN domain-containing protein [Kitasatospora purpeofusca]WSR36532.1 RICIN domain-containing protein [Kitasatospora purpeofusca]